MSAILKKIQGCLMGALMGDCLGKPFEYEACASPSMLVDYFRKMYDPDLKVPYKSYSDDTVMTRCLIHSLIEQKSFSAIDIAKRFVSEFYLSPERGYGPGVVHVFQKLRASKFEDPLGPARQQFDGTGSYGNGAAMRVAPAALFHHDDKMQAIELARNQALITHSHRDGYNGAILQALAVHLAFNSDTAESVDVNRFADSLITDMEKIEKVSDDDFLAANEVSQPYVLQLKLMKQLLEEGDKGQEKVVDKLGNSVTALLSVPSAIYCFLRGSKSIPSVPTDNPVQRAIHLAISLGGDTDTIASMAGAIAGAYYGIDFIPAPLIRHLEAPGETNDLSEKFYRTIEERGTLSVDEP